MTTELLVAATATRLLAAGSKLSMALLVVYIIRRLGTTRPRIWWLVAAGEVLPAGALILESAALVWGFGEWVYAIVAACAVAMAACAAGAWSAVHERVSSGLPPVEAPPLRMGEQELAEMIRRAEERGAARVLAGALLARAGPTTGQAEA